MSKILYVFLILSISASVGEEAVIISILLDFRLGSFFTTSSTSVPLIPGMARSKSVKSIDFVPKDTGTIKITVELQDAIVIISVKDNGCGIPKEELGNLFRKFYQTNASKNRERNSSGLGLSICSSIIDLHHGKMWAESDIGCGTTIKFQLPLIPTQQVESKTLIEETI